MTKRRKLISLLVAVTLLSMPAAAQTSADLQAATQKLGVFVGKWRSEATRPETAYGHADKITSSIQCSWSPQGNFLICEQTIHDSSGSHIQLSVYSYNSKDGNYTISSMAGAGKQPWNGTVNINGSIWTYPGSFEANGKKIEVRTINDFSVPGVETFKTEFSADGGAHWVVTLQGTAHRVKD